AVEQSFPQIRLHMEISPHQTLDDVRKINETTRRSQIQNAERSHRVYLTAIRLFPTFFFVDEQGYIRMMFERQSNRSALAGAKFFQSRLLVECRRLPNSKPVWIAGYPSGHFHRSAQTLQFTEDCFGNEHLAGQ